MLGRALAEELRGRRWPVLALSRQQADLRDDDRVGYWLREFSPEIVFNCAAYTRVDDCEDREALALEVNGEAVGRLARAAATKGSRLVHVSSDYVFDGTSDRPYREDDEPAPLSAYGRSKLLGERRALETEGSLVVRASWLFGPGASNFVLTMLRLIREGRTPLRVVDDQVGAPTYTPFLARGLTDLAARRVSGVIHYRNREEASWFDFAREIATAWDPSVEVIPVPTEEYPRPARRPARSVLDVSRFESTVGRRVEPWLAGLTTYLESLRTGSRANRTSNETNEEDAS